MAKKTNTSSKKTTVAKKKTATKKPTTKAKPSARTTTARKFTPLKIPAIRRPDQSLPPDVDTITGVSHDVQYLTEFLSNYAAHLRALDRMRHNGVGLKRQGFIEASDMALSKVPRQAVWMKKINTAWRTTKANKTSNARRLQPEQCAGSFSE